ncbi:MAG: ParB/RepB/Spo0J family partition protein [Pseudomonadota bacterium]
MTKRKALGKGLSALIPDFQKLGEGGDFFQCPIEEIEPNPYQPRKDFQDPELEELARSIKEKGIITPLLVSKTDKGYQLIVGERRWRAAMKAGLERVPVVVREIASTEFLELALIENIHRKDLNPIEEAMAYKRWLEDSNTIQEELAQRLGKDRSTIANMLRLLKLPQVIQKDIVDGRLSPGHARVLAGLKSEAEQKRLRNMIIKKSLSVRQAERLVQRDDSDRTREKKKPEEAFYLSSITENIKRALGTKVAIRKRGKQGSIVIYFFSDEELDRLIDFLT